MKKIITILFTLVLCFNLIAPTTALAAVKISKTKLTLDISETYTLKISGTNNTIKWSTSNKNIATVSSKGKVSAKAEGSATITATVSKKQYKCKVTVKDVEVNMVIGAMLFDGTTIDEYIEEVKEENPEYIDVEKYDEAHYKVTMLESDRIKLVAEVENEIAITLEEYEQNDTYNGAFTDVKYDKLLSDITLYANKKKYETIGYITIVFPIAIISDYVQTINLVDVNDRNCKVVILDNKTNEILYQTK
jgi:hypothetical protein